MFESGRTLNLKLRRYKIFFVDNTFVFRYGEGWDFGEVATNGRGVNASQFTFAELELGGNIFCYLFGLRLVSCNNMLYNMYSLSFSILYGVPSKHLAMGHHILLYMTHISWYTSTSCPLVTILSLYMQVFINLSVLLVFLCFIIK